MNEMEYIGTNRGLNSNPGDLHVYRKGQHPENTTPAGVGQSMGVWHFSKTNPPLIPSRLFGTGSLQRGTKKLQQLTFGLTGLNRTKNTHHSLHNTQLQ